MLSRSAALASLLLSLAGCATQGEKPPQAARQTQPVAESATVLTMRPVPIGTRASVRNLLSIAGDSAPQAGPQMLEVILRTGTGAILSIVQPEMPGLQPGSHVNIIRGTPTRIASE